MAATKISSAPLVWEDFFAENANISSMKKVPLLIAGPCSAESEEQVLETAKELKKLPQMVMFRAGIWKPRTRPGQFEGMGTEALSWLQQVKKEINLPTCCEVALPKHVEQCLKAEIDVLWIGARTTVNPFLVQEIAEALRGTSIPVMVKNPLNPDLQLWIGAIERFSAAGINKLLAIHRGFSTLESSPYRNAPIWEIPLKLKQIYPQLPLICDPSHMAGHAHLIEELMFRALTFPYQGFMVETHYQPALAKSDAKQQITPQELAHILQKIALNLKEIPDADNSTQSEQQMEQQLSGLRKRIDLIDQKILGHLAARMGLIEEIRHIKNALQLSPLQIQRWNELILQRLMTGQRLGLDKSFVQTVFQIVHQEALRLQDQHNKVESTAILAHQKELQQASHHFFNESL